MTIHRDLADQAQLDRLRALAERPVAEHRGAREPAVTKALTVLKAFGPHGDAVTLGELSGRTGLPKSTVHRMVTFLRSAGLVGMSGGRFLLTGQVTELAAAVPAAPAADAREVLLPTLAELHEATREAVFLSELSGVLVRVVERVYGRRSVSLAARLRTPSPAHCTAAGKVLLAASGDRLEAVVARTLMACTPATITTPSRLHAELAGVRRYGVAFDRGEWCQGLTAVAVPVWGRGGVLVGALSIAGPAERFTPDAVAPRLRRAAEVASRELSGARPSAAGDVAS